MAQVYLALSGELSGFRTLVVVKRILPDLSSNRHFIDMFFDEARIAARLDHPNIVRIIEVGEDHDEYFLAMELVQGKPLSAILRRAAKHQRPFSQAQAAFLVAQAANGLGYAHNLTDTDGRLLNVVHRDVSPQNILVSFDGAVKVIDFGVARALGRISETVPGGLKGKLQYMAPEQVTNGEADRRSDVFALGIVLWEALCGRRLYRRESELETLRAIVREAPARPSSIRPVSPRLDNIVMRALAKDPAERFQSAAEMGLALERLAFATEDFAPSQLAAHMKALFPTDRQRWRATVAATIDLERTPDEWKDTSGTFIRPQDIDLQTRDRTVWLRRGPPPGTPSNGGLSRETPSGGGEAPSGGGETPSIDVVWPPTPPPPAASLGRPRLEKGIAIVAGVVLALGGTAAWSRLSGRHDSPPPGVALVEPRTAAPTGPVISPMPSPIPTPAPAIAPLGPIVAPTAPAAAAPVTTPQVGQSAPAGAKPAVEPARRSVKKAPRHRSRGKSHASDTHRSKH